MADPTQPIRIDPDGIYDDPALVLSLGLTSKRIAKARRSGRLKYSRQGRRILYRGRWILDWLESGARQDEEGGAHVK